MKPDSAALHRHTIERAHLKDPRDASHRMSRYPVPAELADLAQWFWIPVWSVPPGAEAPQHVLRYPCALVVITEDYARFYGADTGLATTTLTGDGWAVGVLLQPAAGWLLWRRPMVEVTDRQVDLGAVLGSADVLAARVRAAMRPAPSSPASHRAACTLISQALRPLAPADDEGLLVNDVVAFVEQEAGVMRVSQVSDHFALTERSLQRLLRRRLGLTPKWLIQRRRLQEASARLRTRTAGRSLADLAADLGYADQSHFTRDFHAVTAMTPSDFVARYG